MTTSKTAACSLSLACFVAVAMASFQEDREPTTRPTVVYIVRHAEKTGETSDADLSNVGKARAEVLRWMLRDIPFDAVYSTDVRRALHTVEPIAKAKGLTVEFYKPAPNRLADIIRWKHSGKTLLVVGHSNTVPALLHSLGAGIQEQMLDGYDDLFIVTLDGSKTDATPASLQRLHYPGKR